MQLIYLISTLLLAIAFSVTAQTTVVNTTIIQDPYAKMISCHVTSTNNTVCWK